MPIESRREYPRTHYINIIRCHAPDLEKTHVIGVSVDISKGGVGMITGYPLESGNILVFEDEIKINNITEKASIVRWATEIEKNRYRVGMEFVR